MRVYRVQSDKGLGPYGAMKYSGNEDDPLFRLSEHCAASGHPAPTSGLPIRGSLFGFASKEQLANWFDKDLMVGLTDYGYSIKEYEVERSAITYRDGCQVAFRPLYAQPLRRVELDEVYNPGG